MRFPSLRFIMALGLMGLGWVCSRQPALGIDLQRQPAPTLQVPQNPGSFGYRMQRFFSPLVFPNGVALRTPPGETNRLFVLERQGRIAVVPDLSAPAREVYLDLSARVRLDNFNEMGLLGLAFHPGYATNGRVFVFYTATATTTGNVNRRHNRLSEFRVSAANPHRADPDSERILFQQADDAVNHNGGDLHFGPDGYLYVSLGDEGGANDQYGNSQTITRDLFAGILRLDVDNRPGSLEPNPHPAVVPGAYRIPADNPYVGATNFLGRAVDPGRVRTEFWAVGLRNPWRMAFDDATGELWVGDVGQNIREIVTVTRAGANHGWAFREGNIAGPLSGAPAGFLTNPVFQHVPPVFTYPHAQGTNGGYSVTGGRVYRGTRLSALFGAYLFSDYVTGNLWALRRQAGTNAPLVTRLTGAANLAGFGFDPRDGELLAVNHDNGQLFRLEYNAVFTGTPLPDRLSGTGAFSDLATLAPASGVVPYEVNLPFWSDGALKRRWFSLPDTNLFLGFRETGAWLTPPGTVWVKHFDLEMTDGNPASRRRLETRFLVRNAGGVHGFTYRWNPGDSDALLVDEAGRDEDLTLTNAVGATRTLRWHYPGRAECLVCHNPAAGGSLSFDTAQLHRPSAALGGLNQIEALHAAGYFSAAPTHAHARPVLARPEDESVSLTWRARSWLEVNCAYCHQPGGPGGAQFDVRLETPLDDARLIPGTLNNSGETNRALVLPGQPALSELHARLSRRGTGQMPPLATEIVDPAGTALLERWIRDASGRDTFDGWRRSFLPDGDPLGAPGADPDQDQLANQDEFRLDQSPLAVNSAWQLTAEALPDGKVRLRAPQPANRAVRFESRSVASPGSPWMAVEDPAAVPRFPAQPGEASVVIEAAEPARFYRAVVFAP